MTSSRIKISFNYIKGGQEQQDDSRKAHAGKAHPYYNSTWQTRTNQNTPCAMIILRYCLLSILLYSLIAIVKMASIQTSMGTTKILDTKYMHQQGREEVPLLKAIDDSTLGKSNISHHNFNSHIDLNSSAVSKIKGSINAIVLDTDGGAEGGVGNAFVDGDNETTTVESNSTSAEVTDVIDDKGAPDHNETIASTSKQYNDTLEDETKMIIPTPSSWCPHCKFSTMGNCEARKSFVMRRYGLNESDAERFTIEQSTGTKGSKCLARVVHLRPKVVVNQQKNNNTCIDSLRGQEGQWVQDREFALQHSFLERVQAASFGLNDTDEAALFADFTLWRWVDANSPVTTISRNGFCQVCYHLDVTRVFIIGDSLSRQFRLALEALLGYVHRQRRSDQLYEQIVNREFHIPCSDIEGTPPHFNGVTIFFHRINHIDHTKALISTPTPPFVESNPNNTVIVFNTGAHMKTFAEYKQGFDNLFAWVQSFNVTSHSKLIPFFRETLPGHPSCGPFKFQSEIVSAKEKLEILQADKTEPYKDYDSYFHSTQEMMKRELSRGNQTDWAWFDFKHANGTVEQYNAYSKDIIDHVSNNKLQVHWLNVYNSTILRRDGHALFQKTGWDCLHYLHPGPVEWWVHLFYSALLDLAGLEETQA